MKNRLRSLPHGVRYLLGSVSAMSLILGLYRLAQFLLFS